MKRSKKMLSRFTSLLHNAVEALAPEMTLLEQFRYHWKCVTQFFLDTTDERVSVENTTIPHHLQQMIQVLQVEEQENGTSSAGPSMEFMLQHKILETMQTLGKADCPPGMKRQVLVFFTNLLGKSRLQLLPHVNVHKPINRMIRCCGNVKAAPTESEEVQFLLQVSSKLKQDPHLVSFFLEASSSTESGSSPSSPRIERDQEKPEYSLVDALLSLMKSEDSRVAIKACEGLLLCTSILQDKAAMVIVLYTAFCEKMADQLAKLFRSLPSVIDPVDLNQLSARWGLDHEDQNLHSFTGKRQLIAFISWLDYVNQLSVEAHPMVAKALVGAIRERFILTAIEPGLAQASEPCAITVTAILTRSLKLVTSQALAQEFADILLGDDTKPETPECQSPHKIRRLLIQRINHLSDQLAIETLRLFQALLNLPYQPILDTLLVRNFKNRNYIDFKKMNKVKSLSHNLDPVKDPVLSSETIGVASAATDIIKDVSSNASEDLNIREETSVSNKSTDNLDNPIKTNENDFASDTQGREQVVHTVDETTDSGTSAINHDLNPIALSENVSEESTLETKNIINQSDILDGKVESRTEDFIPEEEKSGRNDLVTDVKEQLIVRNGTSDDLPNNERNILYEANANTSFSKKRIEKAVNGFLLILPDSLRSSQSVGETGYDSYLRDAHKQCQARAEHSFSFDWPGLDELEAQTTEHEADSSFYEGAFLHTVFNRLARMLDQPYEVNLEVTAIVALICQFRHPYLHEFLMDTSGFSKDNILTLHRILLKACHDAKDRSERIPNCQQVLTALRKQLMGVSTQVVEFPNQSLLEGIVVLEEFCKELAAIAFVTTTMDSD